MGRPKGSTNKKEEDVETEIKETVVEVSSLLKEEFDPSLPENKQRHLR